MNGALVGIMLVVVVPDPGSDVTTVAGAEVTVDTGGLKLVVLKPGVVDGTLIEKLDIGLGEKLCAIHVVSKTSCSSKRIHGIVISRNQMPCICCRFTLKLWCFI